MTGKHKPEAEMTEPDDRHKPERDKNRKERRGTASARGDDPHAARKNILHTLPPNFFKI
jgi:hypothetical protein